ncbi:hypothetical protein JX265_005789 [Neoarthrinium moseri]|uniref:Uncharacterized protein n=1 Tax=Neoarthrinium moseri TaxID=1658444 RepID=A0A9P9WNF8_9PEZI|nr:hypothetical protein JX265_005789 [Neoarthrinium moseri]
MPSSFRNATEKNLHRLFVGDEIDSIIPSLISLLRTKSRLKLGTGAVYRDLNYFFRGAGDLDTDETAHS